MARNILQLSLEESVLIRLKGLSERYGVNVQSLIRLWVGQRLEQEGLNEQEIARVQLHEPLIPQPGQIRK